MGSDGRGDGIRLGTVLAFFRRVLGAGPKAFLGARLAAGALALSALAFPLAGPALADDAKGGPPGRIQSTFQLGEVLVTYFAPEGLQNLWGLDDVSDEFFRGLDAKFKLRVLGAYGDPEEFLAFLAKLKAGEPVSLPRVALFSTTRRMPEKSYRGKSAEKEFTKYFRWFGFATGTGVVALGFEVKANGILEDKLGVDLDFSYDLGKFSKVYERGDGFLSVGLLASVTLNRSESDYYLNTSALQLGDKLVFLTLIGGDRDLSGIESLNRDLLLWRLAIAAANPAPELTDKQEGV
jgi:hypothetical protein